jgi:hypothetical protein
MPVLHSAKISAAATPRVTHKSGGSGGTIQQIVEGANAATNFWRIGTIATHAADCYFQHSQKFHNVAQAGRSIMADDSPYATTASAGVPTSVRHHPDNTSSAGAGMIIGADVINYIEYSLSSGDYRSGTVLEIWELLRP